jgi:hypothetical protein
MNILGRVPEHRLAEALFFDPLSAAKTIDAILRAPNSTVGTTVLNDIRREEGISPDRFTVVLRALHEVGILRTTPEGQVILAVSNIDADSHCSFLRGLAQAQYLQRDANQIEITLSPPMQPSRLMERLPSAGFGWARLHDTKDSLHSLARSSGKRLVIMSPFLDEYGIEWAEELFRAPQSPITKVLIVRAVDPISSKALLARRLSLEACGVKLFRYAIEHERSEREAVLESFHAKIILSDSLRAYIGSSNMNRASRDISLECGVTISGPAVRPVVTLVDSIIAVATPL